MKVTRMNLYVFKCPHDKTCNFLSDCPECARDEIGRLRKEVEALSGTSTEDLTRIREKAALYDAINSPEIAEFMRAVENEALHQRQRWGSEHDSGKSDADWFWLIGYLAGKAIRPDIPIEKMLHHIITTAAACLNWHAARIGVYSRMRPGIDATSVEDKTH